MKEKDTQISEEHKWLTTQNLAQYAGRWLAVFHQRIIAQGKDLSTVVKKIKAKKIPDDAPLYVRVPEGLITV